MSDSKKNKSVIAICIQEVEEDGSKMEFGAIAGANLRILHQAFITDTLSNALKEGTADVRLYFIDNPERQRLVTIITDYLAGKLSGRPAEALRDNFSTHVLKQERWGIRLERIFEACFADGYESVLVAGSRTPTIRAEMFTNALRMLQKSDAVFGPSPEGRYYQIGMSGSYAIKLSEFDWKSPSIYSEVASAFTDKELSWSEMEIWYTVETADELEMMVRDINQFRFEGDEYTGRETEAVLERLLSKLEP